MEMALKQKFEEIVRRVSLAANNREIQLVAVSKRQPIEAIIELYQLGQRVFAENYIQELLDKSCDERVLSNCPDIEWRFIGHLQTNKINQLLRTKNLKSIETIDSQKIAKSLQKSLEKINQKLKIKIQINTSLEENKNGIKSSELSPLVTTIIEECPNLILNGLMTIGRANCDVKPNPDFLALIECKNSLNLDLKLSFGMSDDFEEAIILGSNEVRIGTLLFGERIQ